ncbi:hypothetical protein swp_4738 [Shewanella piezotolerans WP3]|uniref:Uncharacterized protein n=1 Tax=Shewanella piezotolerans (strain WP3 / JCM 13877) TaxID=225849 RepID=B8CTX6_SHEPW|nr:hypothetical protein swp_4738 [Shewanella piezotolerans WP3]
MSSYWSHNFTDRGYFTNVNAKLLTQADINISLGIKPNGRIKE